MPKMEQNTDENREQKSVWNWQASVEKAKKQPKILPTLKLEVGQSAKVEFLETQPSLKEYMDKKKQEMTSNPAIIVRNLLDGKEMLLWVTGASIESGIAKLFAENDETLLNVQAEIKAENYKHKTYGTVKGYRVEQIKVS